MAMALRTPPGVRPGVPLRALAALAVAVLAVHLLVLQARPGPLSLTSPWGGKPLITRVIQITPPAAVQPQPPAPAPAPRPAPALRAPVEATAPAPAPTPAPQTPPAPTAVAAAVPPTPEQPLADALPQASAYARPVTALAIPGSVRMRFTVNGESRGQPYNANAALFWRHDGEQYEARLEVSVLLLGARQQSSSGRVTLDGLAPRRFADRSRTEQAAHFERDAGRISFSGNAPSVPLLPGAQDRLSVLLQLGAVVAGDPERYRAGSVIAMQTAGTREADLWIFNVVGDEQMQLPGGEVKALKLERLPRREFDQKVEVWIDPAQDYLPVRVRLTQPGGDFVDQQWLATDRG